MKPLVQKAQRAHRMPLASETKRGLSLNHVSGLSTRFLFLNSLHNRSSKMKVQTVYLFCTKIQTAEGDGVFQSNYIERCTSEFLVKT